MMPDKHRRKHLYLADERTAGDLAVKSGLTIERALQMSDEELARYGNPPPSLTAEVTDASGNVYRGTLYLVKESR